MTTFEYVSQVAILSYFLAVNGVNTMLMVVAFFEIRQQARHVLIDDYGHLLQSRFLPGLSVVVPCYNEGIVIVENVRSLLASKYANLEVVLVNDGSTDDTLTRVIEEFELVPVRRVLRDTLKTMPVRGIYRCPVDDRLLVIDKENGGKADSINAGLNASHMPYFCSVDADVILDDEALLRIIKPFVDDPIRTVAGGGIVRLVNACDVRAGQVVYAGLPRQHLALFQVIEYFRAFTAGRAGLSRLNSLIIVSGAFGVFDATLVRNIGGYATDTVGEDLEILVRLHKHLRRQRRPYRVFFAAHPICWTEAPETFAVLGRQRRRWQRGLSEVMWRNIGMVFNPRYGRIGFFAMPVFFVFEWFGPIIEAIGYVYMIYLVATGQVYSVYFFVFVVTAVFWGMLLSLAAVVMQVFLFRWHQRWGSMMRLMGFSLAENLGYRQLTVWWRLHGIWEFLMRREGWGEMTRKGFEDSSDPEHPRS